MLMRKFAATSALLIAAMGVTAGTVNAAPVEEAAPINYTAEVVEDSKAVITTDDSGGAQELVGKSGAGIVTPPDSRETAKALDRIFSTPSELERLGEISGLPFVVEEADGSSIFLTVTKEGRPAI